MAVCECRAACSVSGAPRVRGTTDSGSVSVHLRLTRLPGSGSRAYPSRPAHWAGCTGTLAGERRGHRTIFIDSRTAIGWPCSTFVAARDEDRPMRATRSERRRRPRGVPRERRCRSRVDGLLVGERTTTVAFAGARDEPQFLRTAPVDGHFDRRVGMDAVAVGGDPVDTQAIGPATIGQLQVGADLLGVLRPATAALARGSPPPAPGPSYELDRTGDQGHRVGGRIETTLAAAPLHPTRRDPPAWNSRVAESREQFGPVGQAVGENDGGPVEARRRRAIARPGRDPRP